MTLLNTVVIHVNMLAANKTGIVCTQNNSSSGKWEPRYELRAMYISKRDNKKALGVNLTTVSSAGLEDMGQRQRYAS